MRRRQERLPDVASLARADTEGTLRVVLDHGRVTKTRLTIHEPPRSIEALLRGHCYTEVPDLAARMCGTCPVAYQLSACRAIEDVCGARIPAPINALRRLLCCGEWIESHALYIYRLYAPDLLGYPDAVAPAKDHRADHRTAVGRVLALKQTGKDLVELLGGGATGPANVRVGGFHRAPARKELAAFRPRLDEALFSALETTRWAAGFEFPRFRTAHALLALDDAGLDIGSGRTAPRYPIDVGSGVVTTAGIGFPLPEFEHYVSETQTARSTALHVRLRGAGAYLTGPLARYSLAGARLWGTAADAARAAGLAPPERNPFRSVLVRAVEIIQAVEEAQAIIDAYETPDPPFAPVELRPGRGFGAAETPCGLLYHRYDLEARGLITAARIVSPAAQNQAALEADLRMVVRRTARPNDDRLAARSEQAIRDYARCVSCSARFLGLDVTKR